MKGTITAMITPFSQGALDINGLKQNIDFQIENGVSALLLLGTTGEAPTLSSEEKRTIISTGVLEAKGRVPIWVGTGSNSTQETIERTQEAHDLGADVALIVTPYYNKPSQEGIFRHFEAVTSHVAMPVVVYNIPGRCGQNIETNTLARIADLPNIVGVKEASGSVQQASEVLHRIALKHPHFAVLSGDDALTLPMMALGAKGVISVVSNLVPQEMVALTTAALHGDFSRARQIHHKLFSLFQAAFLEVNPVPIKEMMSFCGLPAGQPRLPLYEMHQDNKNRLIEVLNQLELVPCNVSL